MSGYRKNPYVTSAAVWVISSFGLGLAISFPISFVVLLFALAVIGCSVYKAYHRDLNSRDLTKNLFLDLRRFVAKIFEDFELVFARVSVWWLRREARLQQEMAQEHERRHRKKEKLAQLERKRKARRLNESPPTEGIRAYEDARRRHEPKAEQQD
jgi:hypothetical protein